MAAPYRRLPYIELIPDHNTKQAVRFVWDKFDLMDTQVEDLSERLDTLEAASTTDTTAATSTTAANTITSIPGQGNLFGTINQVNLSDSGIGVLASRDITLSIPQDIAVTSSPTFNSMVRTGGLIVGFSGTPINDLFSLGDTFFGMNWNAGTTPIFNWDSGSDRNYYTRSSNLWTWEIGGGTVFSLSASVFAPMSTNISFFDVTGSFGGGTGVTFVKNASANPGSNPTGGGILYSDAGAGKWRGSGGTTTTFGPADPHCPTCGRDATMEWQNEAQGWHYAFCLPCLVDEIESLKPGRVLGTMTRGIVTRETR